MNDISFAIMYPLKFQLMTALFLPPKIIVNLQARHSYKLQNKTYKRVLISIIGNGTFKTGIPDNYF